jgi:hypothetical protein
MSSETGELIRRLAELNLLYLRLPTLKQEFSKRKADLNEAEESIAKLREEIPAEVLSSFDQLRVIDKLKGIE